MIEYVIEIARVLTIGIGYSAIVFGSYCLIVESIISLLKGQKGSVPFGPVLLYSISVGVGIALAGI